MAQGTEPYRRKRGFRAYVIVVSEETGAISLARGGVLYRDLSPEQLKNMISQPRKEGSKKTFATIWKGRQEKE